MNGTVGPVKSQSAEQSLGGKSSSGESGTGLFRIRAVSEVICDVPHIHMFVPETPTDVNGSLLSAQKSVPKCEEVCGDPERLTLQRSVLSSIRCHTCYLDTHLDTDTEEDKVKDYMHSIFLHIVQFAGPCVSAACLCRPSSKPEG
jgi:hypothetical protein